MAAKTLNEFYKQWREPTSGGFIRLFKDIRDQDVWEEATKSAEEKFTAANKASPKLPADIVEGFHALLAKHRSNMWSNEQNIMDQVASFISR